MIKKENQIHRLLRRLGAHGGYLGYYYAASAIEIVQEKTGTPYQFKWLYNEVAARYHTTPYCVERNIRTMVETIWSHGNRELLLEIFPNLRNQKPKNAQFIDGLAVYLLDMEPSGSFAEQEIVAPPEKE